MIEKPTNLDYILAITPLPILGEKKAKKVAIYETMVDSLHHKEIPDFMEIYTQATTVSYRLYAYCMPLLFVAVSKISSMFLDIHLEKIIQ